MAELVPESKTQEPPIKFARSFRTSKRYWFNRWPEFMTASFLLVMYVLTIGSLKRQPVVIIKRNASKPNSEVYCHQIIQRQSTVLFSLYEDYFAKMASTYPALHFNLIFMIDDTFHNDRGAFSHLSVYSKLINFHSKVEALSNFQIHNGLKIKEFQHKYQNVEVMITTLSEYMDRTPLKYKWRTIPLSNIPFYARIYSVWQTGGIGIDLPLQNITDIQYYLPIYSNMQYHSHRLVYPDKRLEIILKHHNDGIQVDDYRRMLDNFQRNKENEFVSLISDVVNQIVKDTTDFFNATWFSLISHKEVNTSNSFEPFSESGNIIDTSTNVNTGSIKLETAITTDPEKENKTASNKTSNRNTAKNKNGNKTENNLMKILLGENKENSTRNQFKRANTTITTSTTEQIEEYDYAVPNTFLTYHLYVLSDGLGAMSLGNVNSENEQLATTEKSDDRGSENTYYMIYNKPQSVPSFLTFTLDGSFVASTSVMHPILGRLLLLDCRQLSPKAAIEEAFLAQCSVSSKDVYCSNIYSLNLD